MILNLPNIGAQLESNCNCDITDKPQSNLHYICTMLNRTNQMMEYENLPDTIPQRYLELVLQIHGHADFLEHNGKYYIFAGRLGGAPDPNYYDTLSVIANPALKLTGAYKIANHLEPAYEQDYDGECVVMRNDTQMLGLIPLFSRYASQLVENDISIRCAQINMRTRSLISASTDVEAKAAQKYLDEIEKGHVISVAEKAFLEGIKVQQHGTQAPNTIIQLIELQQYLKAAWFNDMGLNANFNMKREYMSAEEIRVNTDVLLPLIDDMLQCRQEAVEFINNKYGLDIKVKKNSAWERKQIELDTAQDKSEGEVISLIAEAEESTPENAVVAGEIVDDQVEKLTQDDEPENIVELQNEDGEAKTEAEEGKEGDVRTETEEDKEGDTQTETEEDKEGDGK